jgi:pimeloyl-ACP methyl ester carboxylesterase
MIPKNIRVHARPNGLRGGLGLYRTAVTKDVDDWKEHSGRILEMPNLVLWGARDPVLPPIYVEGLGEVLSDLEVHIHDEAGHFLHEEVPEWCASRMRDFLSRCLASL